MRKKVLIFEDDPATAEFSGILAEQLGFDTAYRTTTANVITDVIQESPDLVIMDNWIAGEGGYKSIELLKANPSTAHIPIVFYSAGNDFAQIAHGSKADAYLVKPFDIGEFEEIISRLLA
ncbi:MULTISPECIES: response regulator [Sphingobacterium]|uniref:Two-component system response regulator n=1 Tax=Sphingobacterium populi TaxID=1812824 RepID=A0ABW5UCG7_9SPHI|nr:response regulator [Sphingobacterium sp. CFCC 11742]